MIVSMASIGSGNRTPGRFHRDSGFDNRGPQAADLGDHCFVHCRGDMNHDMG